MSSRESDCRVLAIPNTNTYCWVRLSQGISVAFKEAPVHSSCQDLLPQYLAYGISVNSLETVTMVAAHVRYSNNTVLFGVLTARVQFTDHILHFVTEHPSIVFKFQR